MSLFPVLRPIVAEDAPAESLPMAYDVAWDFVTDKPIFRGGEPLAVTGQAAVRVWCWNALKIVRRQWPSLSAAYGNDAERLIGTPYSEELKKAEATRYVKDCLMASPYVAGVELAGISFEDTILHLQVRVKTIYGEVALDV